MFYPDKITAHREALRVLKPDGRYVFNVRNRIEENEIAHIVTQTLAQRFPKDPPKFLARTPHGHGDAAKIKSDLTAAGFARVDIQTIACRARAASAHDAVVGYCEGTPLRAEIEAQGELAGATAVAAEAVAARFGTGPLDTKIQALVVTTAR